VSHRAATGKPIGAIASSTLPAKQRRNPGDAPLVREGKGAHWVLKIHWVRELFLARGLALCILFAVITFLRLVGLINAAVWFGGAIFFTFGTGPAFFSPEMMRLLGRPHAGAAAQLLLERYFFIMQLCSTIALLHLLVEWLYTGKPLQNFTLGLLVAMLGLSLMGGQWFQPKLQRLHREMFVTANGWVPEPITLAQKAAEKSFRAWHGVSQGVNLLYVLGLVVYFGRIADFSGNARRFRAAE
jgi:hypothetical protein